VKAMSECANDMVLTIEKNIKVIKKNNPEAENKKK
jgi:hypothetical protein